MLALNVASASGVVDGLDEAFPVDEDVDVGGGAGAGLAKAICAIRFGAASSALALSSSSLSCWIVLSRSANASMVRIAMTSGSNGVSAGEG